MPKMEEKAWVRNWGNLSPKWVGRSCAWFWFQIWRDRSHCL